MLTWDSSPAVAVYTSAADASSAASIRERDNVPLAVRQDECTVTTTFTTTVGQTYVFVPGPKTSTYTHYTAFTQATVTSTAYKGTAWVIASAAATTTCDAAANATATTTQDSRCAPSAMISAAGGANNTQYGLEWKSDVPTGVSHCSYIDVTNIR